MPIGVQQPRRTTRRRLASPLVYRRSGTWSQHDALETGRSPGLDDEHFRARGVDPGAEARQIVVHRGQHPGPAGAQTLAQPELKRLEEFGGDADGDPFGGFPDRIAREVGSIPAECRILR